MFSYLGNLPHSGKHSSQGKSFLKFHDFLNRQHEEQANKDGASGIPKQQTLEFELKFEGFGLVGPARFELATSPLSGVRSNQLSYEPEAGSKVYLQPILVARGRSASLRNLTDAPRRRAREPDEIDTSVAGLVTLE